jgi:hypothetical protein
VYGWHVSLRPLK